MNDRNSKSPIAPAGADFFERSLLVALALAHHLDAMKRLAKIHGADEAENVRLLLEAGNFAQAAMRLTDRAIVAEMNRQVREGFRRMDRRLQERAS